MDKFKINKQKKNKLLQDSFKEEYMPKSNLFQALGNIENYKVIEIGTETGYYSEDLCKAVGPKGNIYCVDLNPDTKQIITYTTKGQKNVKNILTFEDKIPLDDNSIDLVVSIDSLHQFEDVELVMKEIHRILKPQSKFFIADFSPEYTPPPGPPKNERIYKEDCKLVCQDVGFRYLSSWNLSIYHYSLIFQKK
ncbi:MAG: class I SAM-dependent methyltransferase [Vampirovibrionia bacterium]